MEYTWMYNEFDQAGIDFKSREMAENYDQLHGTDLTEKRKLAQKLGIQKGYTVIEFGCGTGMLSIACAERGAQLYSIDISDEMLRILNMRAEEKGLENIIAINAGFLSYSHTGEKADFILSETAFHHLPDAWKGYALARWNSFMKLDGILFLRDVNYCFSPAQMKEYLTEWSTEMPKRSGWSEHAYANHTAEEFSTFDWIIEGLLKRTGFEITEKHTEPEFGIGGWHLCRKIKDIF